MKNWKSVAIIILHVIVHVLVIIGAIWFHQYPVHVYGFWGHFAGYDLREMALFIPIVLIILDLLWFFLKRKERR